MLQKLEKDYAPCPPTIPSLGAEKKDQIVANILKGLHVEDAHLDGITSEHLQKQADAAYNRSSCLVLGLGTPSLHTSTAFLFAC